ncbi:Ig-like domain-containing protein [Luteolibacter luteus]|uniref:SH3b domain-containing protein n=1 Tax=Luteolibacter luteus TaxID=2728835 RepID=A0A858RHN7_9BACT|nr:Ig-like domain-containing protein [Luteolibacter luteus]QJE96696.1 hypothetical protein HHL09_13190 [Luteolibacter luteus]
MAGRLMVAVSLLVTAAADQAPLTASQVATLAYNKGFRGGSLMAAIAVASAESSFDPDAVCNNLQEIDGANQPIFYPNGKPKIATISTYDGTMLPLNQIYNLSSGGRGKVIGHCRGLWQINSMHYGGISNAATFDPAVAVGHAWDITRGGGSWAMWTSVMTGSAWQPARLAMARAAARAIDPTVLPENVAAGTRIRAWTSGGAVRATAGGAFIRSVRQGDTGTILAGPVMASITQKIHTSQHLWYRIQWDHGTTGWCVEEYLTQNPSAVQIASQAYNPFPENGKVRLPIHQVNLQWNIGANTKEIRLRFGTDPALATPDTVKLTGGFQTAWTASGLQNYQNYYWRVDSVSGNGTLVQGPTWTFRTVPVAPQPVTLSNITVTPKPAGVGQMITIRGLASSPGPQPVIIGASVGTRSDPDRDLVFNVPGGNVPTQFTRTFQLPADLGFGSYELVVAAWQDADGNNTIEFGDPRITQATVPAGVVIGDVTLPGIANLSASSATHLPNQAIQLSATATDSGGSGLAGVYFYRAIAESNPVNWMVVAYRPATGNGPVTLTAQDNPPTEGLYWYEMEAVDAGGNRRRLAAPAPVRIQIPDLAPPVATWVNPENGMTIGGGITVTGQATDDRSVASVYYRVNGGAWVQVFQNFYQWSASVNLQPGSNLIEMRAVDIVGKSSQIEPLYLYSTGGGPSVFDERIDFNGNQLGSHWQVDASGPFDNGIANERLQATQGNTAAIRTNKTVPANTIGVELRFAADSGSGVYWQDNASREWRIALKQNQNMLEVGYLGAVQNVAIPGGFSQQSRIRTLWRDGHIEIEFVLQGQQQPIAHDLAFPLLKLSNLTGMMEFRVQADFSNSATMDDIQLRALRPWDRFVIERHSMKSGQNSKLRWPSFAGRSYAIETSPTMGANTWTEAGQVLSQGLVTEQTFTMPAGKRRFVRVRELP